VVAVEAARAGTRAAGRAVATAASRAKGPLIVGGAAAAGIAGAAAARNHGGSRSRRRKRFGGIKLPTRNAKLDLDTVASTGQRIASFGQQLSDVASALDQVGGRSKKR
jgi:hypothetical protein